MFFLKQMEIVFFIKVVMQYAYICFKFDKLDTILDLPNFGVFAWRCLLADYLGGYHQSGEPVGQRMMMNIKVGLDSWKADDRLASVFSIQNMIQLIFSTAIKGIAYF